MIRTYTELMELPTFMERFKYLKIGGRVGESTFGYDRWINQSFYRSGAWKDIRRQIIIRDLGCDLADPEHEIGPGEVVYIHHMNPITKDDIADRTDYLMNPEYLICTTLDTHNAIHYGDESLLIPKVFVARRPNDMCPWR